MSDQQDRINPILEMLVFLDDNGEEKPITKYFSTIPLIPRVGDTLNLIYLKGQKASYRDDMPSQGIVKSVELMPENFFELDYVGFTSTYLTVRLVLT